MLKLALSLLPLLALSANAQSLTTKNSYVLLSNVASDSFWAAPDWLLYPGIEPGPTNVMQIIYKNAKVATVPMTFDLGNNDKLTFYMDLDGVFRQGTGGGAQTTQFRFSKTSFVAEIWKNGVFLRSISFPAWNPSVARAYQLSSTDRQINHNPVIMDSAYHWVAGFEGDLTGHSRLVEAMIVEALGRWVGVYRYPVLVAQNFIKSDIIARGLDPLAVSEGAVTRSMVEVMTWLQPQFITASFSWWGQSAKLYKCMTQYAWQKGFRVIKAAGNSRAQCDEPNPYVINVSNGSVCTASADYIENPYGYTSLQTGSSLSVAKITGYLARQFYPNEVVRSLTRWHGYVPEYCSQIGLPANVNDVTDWGAWYRIAYQFRTDGTLVTSGTSATSRPITATQTTTF